MSPLHIAALVALQLQRQGHANKQAKLGMAMRNNPYYTPKPQAPIWNLADVALMLYGLKGSGGGPKGQRLAGDNLAFSDWG